MRLSCCQWETRLLEYDRLHKNEYSTKKTSIDPYWCVSICCLILSVLELDYCSIEIDFYITIMVQVLILIICIWIFIKKRPDYLKLKEKYIKEWQEIK